MSALPPLPAGPLEPERTGSSGEPVVSAELADLLQDADTLTVLTALSRAIDDDNRPVMRYCAQVLHERLHRVGKETP